MVYKKQSKDLLIQQGYVVKQDQDRNTILDNSVTRVEGFEPPNGETKTHCLTTWRHPIGSIFPKKFQLRIVKPHI